MSEPAFDVAWRAFAEDDARVKAPARVRFAVMAAWDAANQERAQTRSARNYFVPAGALLAAAAVLVAMGLALLGGNRRSDRAPAADASVARETPSTTIFTRYAYTPEGASRHAAPGVMPPVRLAGTARVERSVPMVRLTADPAFETESLQIVRLRVPRASLEVFGVAL